MERMEIVTGILVSTFPTVFCDLYSSPISDTRTAGLYFLGSASQIGIFLDILRNPKQNMYLRSLYVCSKIVFWGLKIWWVRIRELCCPATYKLVQYILHQQEISFLTRRAIFLFQLFSNLQYNKSLFVLDENSHFWLRLNPGRPFWTLLDRYCF